MSVALHSLAFLWISSFQKVVADQNFKIDCCLRYVFKIQRKSLIGKKLYIKIIPSVYVFVSGTEKFNWVSESSSNPGLIFPGLSTQGFDPVKHMHNHTLTQQKQQTNKGSPRCKLEWKTVWGLPCLPMNQQNSSRCLTCRERLQTEAAWCREICIAATESNTITQLLHRF